MFSVGVSCAIVEPVRVFWRYFEVSANARRIYMQGKAARGQQMTTLHLHRPSESRQKTWAVQGGKVHSELCDQMRALWPDVA